MQCSHRALHSLGADMTSSCNDFLLHTCIDGNKEKYCNIRKNAYFLKLGPDFGRDGTLNEFNNAIIHSDIFSLFWYIRKYSYDVWEGQMINTKIETFSLFILNFRCLTPN